jgi:hypothetical protein
MIEDPDGKPDPEKNRGAAYKLIKVSEKGKNGEKQKISILK